VAQISKVDAATVSRNHAAVALCEHLGQGARAGGSQPEPQEVPLVFRLRRIFESRPVVEQRVIVHQLHVTSSKLHEKVQSRVVGKPVKGVESLCLYGRERRDLGKTAGGFDVGAMVETGMRKNGN
jgi:hypothetical protein